MQRNTKLQIRGFGRNSPSAAPISGEIERSEGNGGTVEDAERRIGAALTEDGEIGIVQIPSIYEKDNCRFQKEREKYKATIKSLQK